MGGVQRNGPIRCNRCTVIVLYSGPQFSNTMHVHSTPTLRHGQDQVRLIARHLLAERLDELTDQALERLVREEPAYAALTMDAATRRRGMRRTLELALGRVAGDSLPAPEQRATTEVGRERAEQGFPLDALMHSFQLDLRVLWEAVLAEARRRRISTDADFQDALIRVWEAIDANTVEVVQAFRRTEREIAERRNELRGRAFERLLLDSDSDRASVGKASSLLGLAIDSPLLVLVADGLDAGTKELRGCRDALERSATPHHFGWIGDELVGLMVLGRGGDRVVREALEPLSAWRCGAALISDLSRTASGVRLARAAVRGVVEPGVHALESRWVEAFASADDELGAALVGSTITPLLAASDRDSLLETLRAYLRIGSVAGVAEETYRHRNTVRNRLHSIQQLCGVDLSVPRDLAAVALALSWWEASERDRR